MSLTILNGKTTGAKVNGLESIQNWLDSLLTIALLVIDVP